MHLGHMGPLSEPGNRPKYTLYSHTSPGMVFIGKNHVAATQESYVNPTLLIHSLFPFQGILMHTSGACRAQSVPQNNPKYSQYIFIFPSML